MNTKPIIYYDWQRHWYRLLDFVQTEWSRFAASRTGRFVLWLVPGIAWLIVKLCKWFVVALLIVGPAVLYIVLSFCVGKSKVMKASTR